MPVNIGPKIGIDGEAEYGNNWALSSSRQKRSTPR